MIKITNKNTKQELANFLEEVLDSPKYTLEDKSLVDMATYTIKKFSENAKEVLKADLLDVATELQEYITPKQVVLVENKIKTVKKEEPTKETKEAKTPLKIDTKEPKEEPKAKKETKKVTKKEEKFVLPKELKLDLGTFSLDNDILNVEELSQAMNSGREFVLAVYWTSKLLKQFPYASGDPDYQDIKSFPLDYDVSQPVYFVESMKSLYALSTYTENMGKFSNADFEIVGGVRYVGKAEWGLYENLEVLNEVDEESVKELEEEEAKEDTK